MYKCGVVTPYNPQYDISNTLCSNCATYQNADKLLGGYRSDKEEEITHPEGRGPAFINPFNCSLCQNNNLGLVLFLDKSGVPSSETSGPSCSSSSVSTISLTFAPTISCFRKAYE